jgi:hypothetical protein
MHYIKSNNVNYPIIVDYLVVKSVCAKYPNVKFSQFIAVLDLMDELGFTFHESLKRGHKLEGIDYSKSVDESLELLASEGVMYEWQMILTEDVVGMNNDPAKKKTIIEALHKLRTLPTIES